MFLGKLEALNVKRFVETIQQRTKIPAVYHLNVDQMIEATLPIRISKLILGRELPA